MNTILLTAIGGDISQGVASIIRQSHRSYRLIGSDMGEQHAGSFFVETVYPLPAAEDPNYLEKLKSLIRQENIKIIFPLSEPELLLLNSLIPFENKLHWVWPGHEATETCLDKLATSRKLAQLKIPVPWTLLADEDLPSQYPCIFKHRRGSGSKNFSIVYNKEQAHYLRDHHPGFIFQEFLEAEDKEVTCAVYRTRDGTSFVLQMLRRLKGGFTTWAKIINDANVQKMCESVAEGLNLRGSMNIQMRLTSQGPRIFEINPRYSSTSLMRHQVGFTDVLWALDEIEGEKIHFPSIPTGKILVRIQGATVL